MHSNTKENDYEWKYGCKWCAYSVHSNTSIYTHGWLESLDDGLLVNYTCARLLHIYFRISIITTKSDYSNS